MRIQVMKCVVLFVCLESEIMCAQECCVQTKHVRRHVTAVLLIEMKMVWQLTM